jgi:hypothetical protein
MRPVRSSILAVAAILLATAPALAESKVSQCKRLAMYDQKANVQSRSLAQQQGGDPVEQFGRILKFLENTAKQTRAMQFQDVALKGFQQQMAEIYEQGHDDLVDVYDGAVHRDKAAVQQGFQKLTVHQGEAKALTKQVNQYCGFTVLKSAYAK